MSAGRTVLLGSVLALAASAGAVLGASTGGGFADALFLAIVSAALVLTAWWAAHWASEARRERAAARDAIATPDAELVGRAVVAERARLAKDIDRELRVHLMEISSRASSAEPDVGEAARAIHRASREATTELRRRLGLLREVQTETELTEAEQAEPRPTEARTTPMRQTSGAVFATAVLALAAVESLVYPALDGGAPRWAAVAASMLAATSLVWARVDPAISAVVAASVWAQAALTGVSVVGGFWVIATLGPISYVLVAHGRGRRAAVAGAVLVGGVVTGTLATDPGNTAIDMVTIGVGAIAGAIVRVARDRASAARGMRDARDRAVQPAVEVALREQRGLMARELHDTVAHAIGVVAMQAAAAEVSWPDHPDRARDALVVANRTADAALAELDAVGVGVEAPVAAVALVARFRAAGLDVQANLADVPVSVEPLAGRIVQESLTNVMRHSGARGARVDVESADGRVRVVVADDGTADGGTPPGFGLTGLRERVELADGTFDAGPRSPRGFAVIAEFPMPVARDDA